MAGSNFSILVDVELQTNNIRQQLEAATKGFKIDLNTTSAQQGLKGITDAAGQAKNATDSLSSSGLDAALTFQQANMIFQQSVDTISSMVEKVYEMDSALTEFSKVSDLAGQSLNDYVSQLQSMGSEVARTG